MKYAPALRGVRRREALGAKCGDLLNVWSKTAPPSFSCICVVLSEYQGLAR